MTVPRAASFAFSIRFTEAGDQQALPGLGFDVDIVDEFLTCTEFLVQDRLDSLKHRIQSDAYFLNFLTLTEKIAPDGQFIKMVGFTAIREGRERAVNLIIPQVQVRILVERCEVAVPSKAEPISLRGTLLFADAMSERNIIKILDQAGTRHKVTVPEGLMDDIVRPLWNRQVAVDGSKIDRMIMLSHISAIDE
jgi:hypothetical protein